MAHLLQRGRSIVIRNFQKFHVKPFRHIYASLRVSPLLCCTTHFQLSSFHASAPVVLSRRYLNDPTHIKPDPMHRIYRTARTPKETNRWMERLLLALMCGMCLFPIYFMWNFYDGTVPITNRKRFLIIPFWLDNLVGTYTLQALGIGVEDEDDDDNDNDNDNDDEIEEESTEHLAQTQQDKQDPYAIKGRANHGGILRSEDERVAHIERIFDTIITCNYLKKCIDDKEYNQRTPVQFKKFQDFQWKISIVDKLSVVNAMCVPGGKMIVYTGILKEVVDSDDECAAILCHEIGHAICRHGIEQMQWRLFLIACIYVTFSMFGIDLSWMMDRLLSFGVNVLLQLPMSRRAELEADEVAVYLMEQSGYDLDALVTVMQKLGNVEERMGRMPEFISTHPMTTNRVQILKERIANAKKQQATEE